MRFAVLSDIHSNHIALSACLAELAKEEVDGYFFLGDYVSDCPHPTKTMDLLKEIRDTKKAYFVRGNREESLLEYDMMENKDWKNSSYQGSLLYTYERLRKEDLEWFASMPNHQSIELPDGIKVMLAHGSPFETRDLLNADEDITKEILDKIDEDYLFCGHTHKQFVFHWEGKVLLNPGSIGVAIGPPKSAHYSIVEIENNGKMKVQQKFVEYDYNELKEEFLHSSLMQQGMMWPKNILKSIETGINYGPICAKRAYEIAVEEQVPIKMYHVPERFWIRAANELHI
ncbi:serine/threonine protein phosphatase [Lachnospiraceae bacterium KM106-2]|nr:serine/threonine protein phosphatase [Lachnospiraceae bacterium KM106-2]